ncbi:MAG: DNA-binding protein [Deltaproteobacteria bacterium]|nr:DNA-binding protein [Deltaproteobacteria bacterium]
MNVEATDGRKFLGWLSLGSDLLASLEQICESQKIKLGEVRAIGAVGHARLAHYDQIGQKYKYIDLRKPLNILSLMGNISLQNGKPYIHAHLILGDDQGQVIGGHLAPGTSVFVCEYVIQEYLTAEPLVGQKDQATGLYFWPGKQF